MNRAWGAQRSSRTGLVFYRTVTVNLHDVYVRACPPDSAELRAVSIAHESNPSKHHPEPQKRFDPEPQKRFAVRH